MSGNNPKRWRIEWIETSSLTPYAKNARINDQTVPYLVNSILRFGFKVPLVIDSKNVIVCGHTRLKAAEEIGLEKLPCVRVSDLTPMQVKRLRLADNKIQELSKWDYELQAQELERIDADFDQSMSDFGFSDSFNPDDLFDDENAKKKKKKYKITCPCCGKEVVVEA